MTERRQSIVSIRPAILAFGLLFLLGGGVQAFEVTQGRRTADQRPTTGAPMGQDQESTAPSDPRQTGNVGIHRAEGCDWRNVECFQRNNRPADSLFPGTIADMSDAGGDQGRTKDAADAARANGLATGIMAFLKGLLDLFKVAGNT